MGIDNCVVLRNIIAKRPGEGSLKRLVDHINSKGLSVLVESALSERFKSHLIKSGFIEHDSWPECFWKHP